MKRKLQQCLLGLALLVIVPGALLGMLLSLAAVATGIRSGFALTDPLAIALLIIPTLLSVWGIKLFFRLYVGFVKCTRNGLIWFYSSTLIYYGMWLFSAFSRDGVSSTLFGVQERTIGTTLLLVPLLFAIFIRTEGVTRTANANEEAEQVGDGDAEEAV